MYRKKAHLHFIGIGGIGMSGIAKILKYQGYTISGCDVDLDQQSIIDLQKIGCQIFHGNNTSSCQNSSIDIVVYSSAIKEHNQEIIAAQQRGIPIIPRALMLAELMRTKFSIAIAGAHGKTTTTSLISHILIEAKKDPTVIIGGHLKSISSNAQFGLGDFLVAEADESDRSLVHLQATLAVVTNIDLEHLDVYSDIEDIKGTFKHFLNNLPFYGKAFVCIDDPHIQSLLPLTHLKTVKYGFHSELADIYAKNIVLEKDHAIFDVYNKSNYLGQIYSNMPGTHNVLNCLAAIAIGLELDIDFSIIATALRNFKGIDRRFSFKGLFKNAEIFDDYGHHPEEIKNTIQVARKRAQKKLIVAFQPHRYTRTQKLWDHFIDMFLKSPVDHLIITDIYPASEPPIADITSERFVQALQKHDPSFRVTYVPLDADFCSLKKSIEEIAEHDDLILLQGAGKINKLAHYLAE